VPVVISGIAFLVLPVAIFRGGVVAGFILLIAAAGAPALCFAAPLTGLGGAGGH